MPISLICPCGARLTLDDTTAGREIECPECQEPLQVPDSETTYRRTSSLALASVILSFAGAFTIVGSLVGSLAGVAALIRILTCRKTLSGIGFACIGIVAGVGFTTLTLWALNTGRLDEWAGRLRESMLAHQVDTSGPSTIRRFAEGFEIHRPSKKWGVVTNRIDDVILDALSNDPDLLLVHTVHYAFVDVKQEGVEPTTTINQCVDRVLGEFEEERDDIELDEEGDPIRPTTVRLVDSHPLPAPRDTSGRAVPNVRGRELDTIVYCGKQRWRFVIRIFLTPGKSMYVIRAYAQDRRFRASEEELRRTLEGFVLSSK